MVDIKTKILGAGLAFNVIGNLTQAKLLFNQRLRKLCTKRIVKMLIFRRMLLIFNTHDLLVSTIFLIFAGRLCVLRQNEV